MPISTDEIGIFLYISFPFYKNSNNTFTDFNLFKIIV